MVVQPGSRGAGGSVAVAPILVVDDDAAVLRAISWALEDEGLPVETAADGLQAIERAADRCPSLVVLDANLPFLSGEDVAAKLRAKHGESLPIVLITADRDAAGRARRARALAFLRKPFELSVLLATVRGALDVQPMEG